MFKDTTFQKSCAPPLPRNTDIMEITFPEPLDALAALESASPSKSHSMASVLKLQQAWYGTTQNRVTATAAAATAVADHYRIHQYLFKSY